MIVTVTPHTVTEQELVEFVLTRLAYYMRPVRWYLTTEPLPRNATGKIKRHEVIIDG